MRAEGTLFCSKTAPLATAAADGTFALSLLAFDRMGPHQVEGWRITWFGPAAQAFWHAHGHQLRAGQPITVRAKHIRTLSETRTTRAAFATPEIHAHIDSLALAPWAHINQQQTETT